ncbi:MAG: hypothetical protein LBV71_09415 [Prevotella sp.]|jgi:hypothetical protein|nr:hypothetical protein [Prevotella sp.]
MEFNFQNLDEETRSLMLGEIDHDVTEGKLYQSKRFKEGQEIIYLELLKKIVISGNEKSLATALKANKCFKTHELRKTKSGYTEVKVPENAESLFAEGEFNRFYIRALCLRIINKGGSLEIYRARESQNPRKESEILIGNIIDAKQLLNDLRENIGIDTVLGLPPGPNSGLSVKIIT